VRRRVFARALVIGAGASLATLGAFFPALAAQTTATTAAPYAAAEHSTSMTCGARPVPSCSASAAVDRAHGAVSLSTAVDSGAFGTIPGRADSSAVGQIEPTTDLGDATAATFTFHVHVASIGLRAAKSGSSEVIIWAGAVCDRCVVPDDDYAFPTSVGDQTLTVTLVRGSDGGRSADLVLGTYADSRVDCDGFCLAPSGTAAASTRVVLTRVDIERWGVGRPSAPTISAPSAGATVPPSTYTVGCDTGCRSFVGEKVTGAAEPGMPVRVSDEHGAVGSTTTDDTGRWVVYAALPAGTHTLVATATADGGAASSAGRTFTVAG
jgi:hypothetical protein